MKITRKTFVALYEAAKVNVITAKTGEYESTKISEVQLMNAFEASTAVAIFLNRTPGLI